MGIKNSRNIQSKAADVNEILFGYYLTKDWQNFEDVGRVKAELAEKSKLIGEECLDQDGLAKVMAREALEWMKKNGYSGKIVKRWWPKQNSTMISKAVGFKVDLDKNPLDILVQTDKEKFLGWSAKSSKSKGRIPFKNRGVGSVGKELKLDLKSNYNEIELQMLKKFPQLPKVKAHRKQWLKNNEEFYKTQISDSQMVKDVFQSIRDKIFDKLNSMPKEKQWEYISDKWRDSNKMKLRYMIITGRGVKGKYSATIEDPLDIRPKNLKVTKEGFDKVRIMDGGEKLLDIRVKFESTQMASTIKFSGE